MCHFHSNSMCYTQLQGKLRNAALLGARRERSQGFVEQMADSGVPASGASGHDKKSLEV